MSLGLLSTNLKCVMDAFFTKEFTALFKKMERWPRDNYKVIFLFYLWFENMPSANIQDFPFNSSLNPWYLSMRFKHICILYIMLLKITNNFAISTEIYLYVFPTEDFLKEKKMCKQNLFIISRIRFNNLKILLQNISIYHGKKTWSHLPILLVGV